MEEVDHVGDLRTAREKLGMAGLVADQYQRDPINTVRQFSAGRIYRAVQEAYAAFRYLCPISKKHNDPLHPEATADFERSARYVRQLTEALKYHPDASESVRSNAAVYAMAVEMMLDSLKRYKMTA